MTAPSIEERDLSHADTFGDLLSVTGKILFALTLFSLFCKSALPHAVDFASERFFLSVAGWFVTVGWLLLRGKPVGSALRSPGGAQAVKRILSDVFYPAFAMFAVFCISIVAIILIAAMIVALIGCR